MSSTSLLGSKIAPRLQTASKSNMFKTKAVFKKTHLSIHLGVQYYYPHTSMTKKADKPHVLSCHFTCHILLYSTTVFVMTDCKQDPVFLSPSLFSLWHRWQFHLAVLVFSLRGEVARFSQTCWTLYVEKVN